MEISSLKSLFIVQLSIINGIHNVVGSSWFKTCLVAFVYDCVEVWTIFPFFFPSMNYVYATLNVRLFVNFYALKCEYNQLLKNLNSPTDKQIFHQQQENTCHTVLCSLCVGQFSHFTTMMWAVMCKSPNSAAHSCKLQYRPKCKRDCFECGALMCGMWVKFQRKKCICLAYLFEHTIVYVVIEQNRTKFKTNCSNIESKQINFIYWNVSHIPRTNAPRSPSEQSHLLDHLHCNLHADVICAVEFIDLQMTGYGWVFPVKLLMCIWSELEATKSVKSKDYYRAFVE